MDEAHAEIRWRLVFLGVLSFLAASSTLWMLALFIISSPRGRSVSAMLLATALIAAWINLPLTVQLRNRPHQDHLELNVGLHRSRYGQIES